MNPPITNSSAASSAPDYVRHPGVKEWVARMAQLAKPDRVVHATETPLGWMPEFDDLHWQGLEFGADKYASVTNVDRAAWERELVLHDELFAKLVDRLPQALVLERQLLETRLAP